MGLQLRPLVIEVQLSPNPEPACPVDVETKAALSRGVLALLTRRRGRGGELVADADAGVFERLELPGGDREPSANAAIDGSPPDWDEIDDGDDARGVAIELPIIGADGKMHPLTMYEDEGPGDAAARFCAEQLPVYRTVVEAYAASANATATGFDASKRGTRAACAAFMEGLVRENMALAVGPLVAAQRSWREAHDLPTT